jgi:SAM-dependent methyltransferase
MALPAQIVALLLTEHARKPFAGPVLVYGRQALNFSYDAALWMFESLGIQPHAEGMADPPAGANIDFERLIALLGLGRPQTLDVSPYEGADIIADLNVPVPAELLGRFGLIVDGGTMEHVFDLRQGMKNTADMLRPGGRVVHTTPVNNYVNHGFVQISPTMYHDYYLENRYEDVRGVMYVQPRAATLESRWNFFHYEHATMGGVNSMFCTEDTQMGIYFTAEKTAASTSGRIPMQSYFATVHGGKDTLPYQFIITHGKTAADIRQIALAEPEEDGVLRKVVHSTSIWTLDLTTIPS